VRILLVGAGTDTSTRDVENGYTEALTAAGVDLKLYALEMRLPMARDWLRMQWRKRGRIPEIKPTWADVLYQASKDALTMALDLQVDWVFVVSAMYFHPDVILQMRRAGLKVAVLFTESPYEDLDQLRIAQLVDWCWTNESSSARTLRGGYLPHAYDPARHSPQPFDPNVPAHDVVFVGTGFIERIRLLEAVDWTGIDLGLYGEWSLLGSRHRLRQHVRGKMLINHETIALYRNAKVGLNLFRTSATYGRDVHHHSGGQSANPRTFELAACGVFQISQYRPEVNEIFLDPWIGATVPTFNTADELEFAVREALDDADGRHERAAGALIRVAPHTYAARAAQVLADLEQFEAVRKGA
jgi:spore maturation protein CgeB